VRPLYPIVLCPTDLSDLGNAALPVACRLAQPGGTLRLLCVLEDLGPDGPAADVAERARRHRAEENEARAKLNALLTDDLTVDLETHCHVLRGSDVPAVIEQQARSYGADVVVMSTHGRTGLGRLLIGSVATAVVKRTDLAVVLVHPREA
jgi:nucleotide-binding universal stress UspA family protein